MLTALRASLRPIAHFACLTGAILALNACDRPQTQDTNTPDTNAAEHAATPETTPETTQAPTPDRPPNIIIFYADDLGYGDLSSYGATAVDTPNVDALAHNGLVFTDAHATAATCTPSRYSLLTGEYGFRSQAKILRGDAPALIQPGTPTLPALLQHHGYATAVVGKWHLGLGDGTLDWNGPITPGPLDIGFDYAFLLPATGDRVPTVYVENTAVIGLNADDPLQVEYRTPIGDRPTGRTSPEALRVGADRQHSGTIINGVSRIGFMQGGSDAEWVDEDFPDIFTDKAIAFMRDHADQPFFLFFPFHDPHVPRLPHPRFQGATDMGPRGDAIVQMDWMTGTIMAEIDRLGLSQDTLVIFTSDNGPVLNDGYEDGAVEFLGDHQPAGPLRGGKYSAFEAGARVPTIAHWPGTIPPGRSDALVSQVDLFASTAELVGEHLAADIAIDSQPMLAALLGADPIGRNILFKQSVPAHTLRLGTLKYIAPAGANTGRYRFIENAKAIESGASAEPQLYDLATDIGEQHNLASARPDTVADMQAKLEAILAQDIAARDRPAEGATAAHE